MIAIRLALVALALACGMAGATAGADAPVPPSDLVRDFAGLDGKHVAVAGTIGQIRTHVSKRGERAYSFSVSDERAAVAVLTSSPPACRPGARVIAHGIVDGRSRRIDATVVSCP